MNIKLKSIADKGELERERIVISILRDTDIGDYTLMQTGYKEATNRVTTTVYDTFWFPNKEVKMGDLVIVYTKKGKNKEKELTDGCKAHFFYWKRLEPLWNVAQRGVVILYSPTWESAGVDEL